MDPDELRDSFREYLDRLLDARVRLANLMDDIAEIKLSMTGYATQSQLNELSREYSKLSQDLDEYHETMITLRLDELEGVERTGGEAMNQFTKAIEEGSIPREVDRLSNGAMIVSQQLTAKQIAANTRLALTVSVIAVLIAVLSIVVTAMV